jgi:hypothetical protein
MSLIISFSCQTKTADSVKGDMQKADKEIKVEVPKMDIHAAAFMGNVKMIQQHIKANSDLNVKEPMGGSSPLISATVFGKTEVAIALIEAGADLNCTNNEGSTALHSAAFFCRNEIVEALIKKGADKTIKNKTGATALESVQAPFEAVKSIYDFISKELGPMGFKLDYKQIEANRPIIATMLQ